MDILDAIGNTPLITVDGIYAKLEATNPSGSIKDRMAWHMVKKAKAAGRLRPGSRILEATSGNTGIAFAMISAVRGYRFTAVMPESMSVERRRMMEAFGAKLVLTPANEDMAGAMRRYRELALEDPGAWLPRQFENEDNVEAHELGTGQEIIRQCGRVDAFVAGIGTGGTLLGVARALKKAWPGVKVVGVEPAESAVLSGGAPGSHGIQGIGEGFVPELVRDNRHLMDEVVAVRTRDAVEMSKRLAREHGVLAGISSGANMLAALEARKKYGKVATIFPDRGERYLSV